MPEVLEILQMPSDALRVKCAPVPADQLGPNGSYMFKDFLNQLERARLKHDGVGLAAPQVGQLIRVVSLNRSFLGHRFMINPEIIAHGNNNPVGDEGCLSIEEGKPRFKVKRWDTITVRFQDALGAIHEVMARAFAARVVQHEVDHLDGILITDKVAR